MNMYRPSPAPSDQEWGSRADASARTLDERLLQGKLPLSDSVRIAKSLADALRATHDEGRVHGGLSPSTIELTSAGVNLLPAQTTHGTVTTYTAPEVLRGHPADARSDIFSFGAIVYQMITGRAPFEGDSPEALGAALLNSPVPGTGNPGIDALLANCLAKEPQARWQRMQKAQMELRLLTVSSRRTEGPPRRETVESLVRAEVQQVLEARLGYRLESQEKAIAELQQAVTTSLQSLQAHLCTVDAKLAAAHERAVKSEETAAELSQRISSYEQEIPAGRIAQAGLLLQAATERLSRAEQATESIRKQAADFAEGTTVRLHALEQTICSQSDALEAARQTMGQTDDLVERVVEALDSLQSIVLERSEDRSSSVN